jgi:hypothetical protein
MNTLEPHLERLEAWRASGRALQVWNISDG